ncbi:LysR family transcriptional regulator [Loktanella salsilacus]|jgi:DNA-binding transcriptional LysR family regulator|uniref:LysR family transcriptional regulator n=1 Tax=Loktanella salsilacus TaxID=195913 RepID=UPI0020B6FB92|nr:LysR family transcriptional regulator [Loktanella salsilacus]UTH45269.1 LysR family transcriptional regulator [Loktanella salsilacus]
MDFNQLTYFVATADTGQVSRAANQLAISQSAITSAIRRLEDELGAKLFHRTHTGMELTNAGRELARSARDILDRVEEARYLSHDHAAINGTISIAATYTVMGYFLPYHLERLRRLFPGLKIQLRELPRESIEEDLLTGRLDMALVLTSNLEHPELERLTLFRSARRLWVPNNHPLHRTGLATFEDIAAEEYIMLTVDEAAQTAMRYWSRTGFNPNVKLRTSSTEAVRSMVANGEGVTILSDMVYRPWSLEGRRIGTVMTDAAVPSMDIGLTWHRNREIDGPMAVFRDYFRHAYLRPQATFDTASR